MNLVFIDLRRVIDRFHLNIEHRQEIKITHGLVGEDVVVYLFSLEVGLSCHRWRL